MNDWKKIEAPMLVLSLYSEEQGAPVTILSTSKRDVFVAISDSPLQIQTATSFIGTLADVAEVCGIPFTYLFQEYLRAAYRPDGIQGNASFAAYMGPADFGLTSPAPEQQMQDRLHRLSAQELVEEGYLTPPHPFRKIVGTSSAWNFDISKPKHDAILNEHGKDLSQFLSGQSIPSWVKWVCIDGLGSMYWFENEPIAVTQGWMRDHGNGDIGPRCDIDGHNFRELIWERKSTKQ